VVILVFDGLRTDAWDEFLRPVGKLPVDFPSGSRRESDLLKAWLKEAMGLTPPFQIVRDSDTEASGMVVRYVSLQLEYIVFNFTDENLHHNQNDLALIYHSVVREIVQQDVRSVLRDLPDDALIFVTSDHGFTPMPVATVTIPASAVLDAHDVKYRSARTMQKLSPPDADKSIDFDVRVMGIPVVSPSLRNRPFAYVLFPRAGYIFRRPKGGQKPDRYSHGGLRRSFTVRWSPRLPEITPEVREKGVLTLPVSVQLSYREGEELVRTSKAEVVRIKLDTTRLRRRLDSKLDLLMGKVPRDLKG